MLTTQKDPISEDFIETVRESFLVLDPDLKILKANRNFYHTFMVTPKETIGHLIYDLGKGQWDIPQLRRLFEYLLLKANKIDNFEIQHVFPNLGEKIMLVNACRIIHKKFVPEMILLAIEDITERRRPAGSLDGTEHNKDKEARRKSEERYRTIADFTYNWEYWLAPNQKFLYCSPSCQRITGYSREDFLKDPKLLYKIIHPDDQGIMAGHSHEISEKGEVVPIDFRIIDRTGQEHWISHVCYPVVRVDGRPLGHRASNQDVTERKLAEEALRRVKEEWERTFDSVPDLIAILDHQHRIVRANKAMAERLGCLTTACAGLICYEQVHGMDAPPAYCPHTRTLGDGQEHFAEIQEACLGGDFLVTTTPILDAQGRLIETVHVARDITESKRLEEERIVMSKLESTGILAGGIAHDFNNLLSVILGNLELIKLFDQSGESLTNSVEAAMKAGLEARGLTQQLITLAQGGDPVKKLTSLSGLLQEQVTFALRGSQVTCKFSIPDDLWPVEVDGSQIGQVIRNIVLNAREAMAGGGTILILAENIELTLPSNLPLPPGDYIKTSISDHGKGIPEDILPKIFDPYFSTKQRGNQKGMGLGLTICRSIIQKHGGAITVETTLEQGTTLDLYLPALRAAISELPALSGGILWTARILVMDDEEMIRTLSESTLRQLGFDVELAENGERAIERYQAAKDLGHPFDAVILDLTIRGGMGGKETIHELLKIDPNVKAIVFSGYSNDPVIQDYEKYGFKGALKKPFLIRDLNNILSKVLGSDKTQEPHP